ncbi:unnamed protein product [Staurois parvus]|uniref:Uncharacterized protein n=1 Tax=Staurois parvus TaxID=386267 RepID=A0ABN9EW25_9NEOB|nr:unnamed protein product [Staurois parvus]
MDNNDGALFLSLTPTMGYYYVHTLIPMMGHYSSHTDTNEGALLLPLIPMMGHYSSH